MPYVEASERRRQSVAAARTVMARVGVAATTMRAVAAEAGVPLGTLQYVFPSREQLVEAVVEDVVEEISALLATTLPTTLPMTGGLEPALRDGVTAFWTTLVAGDVAGQLMQGELVHDSLRSEGRGHLARWQYERYVAVLTQWCDAATAASGEVLAVPHDRLARLVLAGIDGLILQYAADPDDARARADLDVLVTMVLALARPTP